MEPLIIELRHENILEIPCDLLVMSIFQGVTRPGGVIGDVDTALGGALITFMKQQRFDGKIGE
ncbi:MAG: hypothetical protein AAB879_00890, partial [Patescibacteria group bacterium]